MILISVKNGVLVIVFAISLLAPSSVGAQNLDRITLQDNFGNYKKGEQLLVFGTIANIIPDSFLIIQIINPNGDLCQIQQLSPLPTGQFISETLPVKGRLCGLVGEYEVKVFYSEYFTTASFTVLPQTYIEPSGSEYLNNAKQLVQDKITILTSKTTSDISVFSDKLENITATPSDQTIEDLEALYSDLWESFFIEDEIFSLDPKFRVPIESFLNISENLLESGDISFDIARDIDRQIYGAMFYSYLGNTKQTNSKLNEVFIQIQNVEPEKIQPTKPIPFAELEETLLNLMTKTDASMSRALKENLAFIFARGTVPLYAEELNEMLDQLTKTRYLDVISRNDHPLYRFIQNDWSSAKSSLATKQSIEEFLEQRDKINKLHQAALLLRDLEKVDRFLSSEREENSELENLILPDWNDLQLKLELASSVENILDSESEIKTIKKVIDLSSRISRTIEISQKTNVNSDLIDDWKSLLSKVEQAQSINEILDLVSEFDQSVNEIREKRNPISLLIFEYETMKEKAELQGDQENLFTINNALKILRTAKAMEEGNPTVNRIDRIEVLLTWVSEKAPEIKNDLSSFSKDVYFIRASDILQRAKSIENLVDLSLQKNRFLPGFIDFSNSMKTRIDDARNLVVKNDLEAADNMVREIFDEWKEVSTAYEIDPFGSETGYTGEELKKIEYRKKLDSLTDTASTFYNKDFEPYSAEFVELTEDVSGMIDYGNYVDADNKINEIKEFLEAHLVLSSASIIYDINYDQEFDLWVLSGFVDKEEFGDREKISVTIYDMDGNVYNSLKFSDTKLGKFFTQWKAPTVPGLYIAMLNYLGHQASQIVSIEDKTPVTYAPSDLSMVELSREFEQLETFIETFGGPNYKEQNTKLADVLSEVKISLSNRDPETVAEKLDTLKRLIERDLPVRSRSAVIEAQYENDKLFISGAVYKTISFREDLFVDIFDYKGNHIEEFVLKDTASGRFNEMISKPFQPGIYVAQLDYHDVAVTDFFTVP